MIRLPVFMYHHVSESLRDSSRRTLIFPDHFEKQMLFLYQNGFHCLSLSEVIKNWRQGKPQPERSFVLTFDDGYVDNYENAAPILNKFGFSATIFVVVKPVEEGNNRYLSWSEMRELAQNNFTFGSHTLTHPRLSNLNTVTIMRELSESKKIMEDQLGLPVNLFAYPYGDSNIYIQDIVRKSGYHAACGVDEGNLTPFNLWRVPIMENESAQTFYWKVYGGYYVYTLFREHTYIGKKMRAFKRRIYRS